MKQLLIFLLLFVSAMCLDMEPASLEGITKDTVTVTVSGAVENEGTIEVPLYSTVGDVISEAVLQEGADTDALNPQIIVKDHDMIVIPEKDDHTHVKISINTATAEELAALPGIGEKTAEKIIQFREENGLFQEIEDIMRVSGIGESRFAKIRDLISL